ncbi:uncharacterized protein LOC126908860 [Daktulosphaira vitifoliae]|nr:uncharacterized protein LOC126908860 [Daktulosphaira vitifoliae]
MILTDVFQRFRRQCLINYKLDPAHYYSCPGLSFDAMLKYTEIELELLTDYDMLLMFELGIRGGLTQVMQRHCRANHPDVPDYDSTQPKKFIQYLDATSLYGTAMMEPMPYGGFKWIDKPIEDILTVPDDN